MTFTYSSSALSDPSSTGYALAYTRLLIGDTSTGAGLPYYTDEELGAFIDAEGSAKKAAAAALESLVVRGSFVDKQVGDLRVSASQQAAQARATADRLRRDRRYAAVPYGGGTSIGERDRLRLNTDVPTPAFTLGQGDHPDNRQPGDGSYSSPNSDGST